MKKQVNFRLNQKTLIALTLLSEQFNTTRTNIIENAVKKYAKNIRGKKNKLLRFAGSVDPKVMDNILAAAKESRTNKVIKIEV